MANDRALFTAELILTTKSDPETPPPGSFCLFPQADGRLYLKNSNGDTYPVDAPAQQTDTSSLVSTSGSALTNQVGVWVGGNSMAGYNGLRFTPQNNQLSISGILAIGNSPILQLGPSRIELRNIGFVDSNTANAIKTSLNLSLSDISGTLPTNRISGYDASGTTNYLRQDGTWQPITVETFPPGMVTPFAGPAAPTGWLLCQGQALPTATYPNLFATIGYTYNLPGTEGGATFNLPDLRQRVPVGVGTGFGLGQTGGSQTHTLTVNEMPSHSHTTTVSTSGNHTHSGTTDTAGAHTHSLTLGDSTSVSNRAESGSGSQSSTTTGSAGSHSHTFTLDPAGDHTHTVTLDNTGGGQPHNNMQPYVVLNYIIKT